MTAKERKATAKPRYAVVTLADGTEVKRRHRGMGRPARRAAVREARRAVKRLATLPAFRLSQLSKSRQEEWRFMRLPQPTHSDGWVMRTLGFLFLWGQGEDLFSGIRGLGTPLKGGFPNPIETPDGA